MLRRGQITDPPPSGQGARRARVAFAAVFLLAAVSRGAADTSTGTVRFIDRLPGAGDHARIIDGVWKRILPGLRARQSVALDGAPANPRLRFSIGFATPKDPGPAKMRFQVVLRRKARAPRLIYERDLDATGWVDAEVDLGTDLDGADVLFQRSVVEGPPSIFGNGCWGEPMLVPGTAPPGTSVILISIDTLRADQVGIYGNAKVSTPTLDSLARAGVWYSNSYSASTWTYPSHASLLYGLYPASLPSLEPPKQNETPAARPPPRNLPSVLREQGYLTAGFTGGGYMSDRWGFTAGFDTYYMFPQPAQTKGCTQDRFDGPPVFDRAERWLRENAARPFFLFVHTYDVHDRCPVWPAGIGAYDKWPDPGPDGRRKLVEYYDSLVQRADSLVAGILAELDTLGLADRVVVAVTGDHGEGFWEHGYYGHGCLFTPYEPLVRVPLIVRPAREVPARGRIDAPVSAVDVAPTLLALAGVQRPANMQGYVLPGLGPETRPESAPIFVQCDEKLAVRVGHHKMIAVGKPPGGREEVYDLRNDPGETTNLITSATDEAAQLGARAREYWQSGSMEAGSQRQSIDHLDEQTRERLRALGYVP